MLRKLLILAVSVSLADLNQTTQARSPDRVKHSPVPKLKLPQRGNTRDTSPTAGTTGANRPTASPVKLRTSIESPSASNKSMAEVPLAELWESQAMQAALADVREFCRRSAQVTTEECEHFIERLSALSPEEMNDWFERYQARRKANTHRAIAETQARRSRVRDSIRQVEAQRARAIRQAALQKRASLLAKVRQNARSRAATKPFSDLRDIGPNSGPRFDPFELVFDPSSPRGLARRTAAIFSLPGDLPAGDPANVAEPAEVQ